MQTVAEETKTGNLMMTKEITDRSSSGNEDKKAGVEAVLDYFPDMSGYQFFIFIYCYYGYMGVATSVAGNIFYQYSTNFECDQYSNSSSPLIQDLAYLNITDSCKYHKPVGCSEDFPDMSDEYIRQCFQNTTIETCQSFSYNDPLFNETIVKEYDLVCDQARMPAYIIMLFNIGMAIGPVISAKIGEKLGRAKQMSIGGVLILIINLLIAFNTIGGAWGYAVLRLLGVIIAMILALPAMVYPTEVLTQKYRSICGLLVVSTALGAGILLVVLFAVFCREWRQLQLIISFVTLPSIVAPWIMPESYRWLYSQDRIEEAEESLRILSKRCGGRVEEEILKKIRNGIESSSSEQKGTSGL